MHSHSHHHRHGTSGFDRCVSRTRAFLRSRTSEHWLMFAAGLILGLLLG